MATFRNIDYSETIWGFTVAFALIGVFASIGIYIDATLSVVLLGSTLILYGWRRTTFGHKTENWPTTEGKLVAGEVKEILVADSEYGPSRYFCPNVEYSYSVNGIDYTGREVGLYKKEYQFYYQQEAEVALSKATSINPLKVYYNPRDPGWGLLEPGLSKKQKEHFLTIQIAGVLIVLSGIFLWNMSHS